MSTEKYLQMQRDWYNEHVGSGATDKKPMEVVGNYDWHEKYPYESFLLLRAPALGQALDFGCGPGRMMRRMEKCGWKVDGVDICEGMIEAAKRWTSGFSYQPTLRMIDGQHLPEDMTARYDLVYTTIAYQHIASYEVRLTLLREFFRVLKPGGQIALQMAYTTAPREDWTEHVDWTQSMDDATQTNGLNELRVSPYGLVQMQQDIEKIGFKNFWYLITPPPHPYPADWLYVYATKPADPPLAG